MKLSRLGGRGESVMTWRRENNVNKIYRTKFLKLNITKIKYVQYRNVTHTKGIKTGLV